MSSRWLQYIQMIEHITVHFLKRIDWPLSVMVISYSDNIKEYKTSAV